MSTLAELQTRLAEVQTQIRKLVTSGVQQYRAGSGTFVGRITLAELKSEEKDLLRRVGKLTRGRFALARRGVVR